MTEFNAHRDIEGDMPPDTPPKPLAGDHADDDGRALDDYFEAMPSGPQSFAGSVWTGPEPVITTRLLTRSYRIAVGEYTEPFSPPTQLLTADPNRISFRVRAAIAFIDGDGGLRMACTLRIADSASMLSAMGYEVSPNFAGGTTFFYFDSGDIRHTGEVWASVYSPLLNTPANIYPAYRSYVSVLAVTS